MIESELFFTHLLEQIFDTIGVTFPDGREYNRDTVLVTGIDVCALRHLETYNKEKNLID